MPGEFDDTVWKCEHCIFLNRPMNRECEVCRYDAPETVRRAQDELKRICAETITQAGGKKNKRKTRRSRY